MDPGTWIYNSHSISRDPPRVIIQVFIVKNVLTNVICEAAELSRDDEDAKQLLALLGCPSAPLHHHHTNKLIDQILSVCRESYGSTSPLFASMLFAKTIDESWYVHEMIDPLLLEALKPLRTTFSATKPLPPAISRSELNASRDPHSFLTQQTKQVMYLGQEFVAKGPSSAENVQHVLSEVTNILNLPSHHPNLAPIPTWLLTVSSTDDRVCGFLIPYYKNGNLYEWAKTLQAKGQFSDRVLREWAIELASVVKFLISYNSWHGDIKPDNILVNDNGQIVLADNTRTLATVAFASPELLDDLEVVKNPSTGRLSYEHRNQKRKRAYLGLPPSWPIQAKELSEVYAYGVTLLVLAKKMSVMEVYQRAKEAGSGPLNWGVSKVDLADDRLRTIVEGCIQCDPTQRPTFTAILRSLGN